MSNKIQSIRGMHDILPDTSAAWQLLELHLQQLMDVYGYHEIRMPLVEKTELFARSIGDVTDIVEKEMYSFTDRNGENLSLRPEGTAGCVRAALEHGLLHNQVQRLWYMGPMFRHERPQKGRYRQFHQLGVEAFGMAGASIEAELILMGARLWRLLDLSDIYLEINSLGTIDERAAYREALQGYLQQHQSDLDADSQRRLHSNPLRILDSKNPQTQAVLNTAPILADYLGSASQAHFSDLRAYLEAAKIDYRVNPRLVRGLDYYSHTVFEWVTQSLGAQGTICAGGRYDGLVQQLGGRPSPAVGFAMGLERVLALLEQDDTWRPAYGPDLYIAFASESFAPAAMLLAESLRDELPELGIMYHCGAGGLKAQLRQADRSGAEYVLILGEDEIQNNTVSLKSLRSEDAQQNIARAALSERVAFLFNLETR